MTPTPPPPTDTAPVLLTPAQAAIAECLASGCRDAEIVLALERVSFAILRRQIAAMQTRAGVRNRETLRQALCRRGFTCIEGEGEGK